MDSASVIFILIGISIVVYLVPSMIAMARKSQRMGGVIVLNIFLGWTLLGWVGSFIWAVIDKKK